MRKLSRGEKWGAALLLLCTPGTIPAMITVAVGAGAYKAGAWGYRKCRWFFARREIGRELAQRGVTTAKRPWEQA